MNVYSGSVIPAFRRHVTLAIGVQTFLTNYCALVLIRTADSIVKMRSVLPIPHLEIFRVAQEIDDLKQELRWT
jgi:hypothetical protein